MPGTSRRSLGLLVFGACVLLLIFLSTIHTPTTTFSGSATRSSSPLTVSHETLHGHAIAPKLGNETVKAELGRAAWKLFHTTMARFPEKPSDDEQTALRSYVYLFQRLYPCGECAEHFGLLLAEFPPQVSSRNAAAGWACHVHNKVNQSLGKPDFDCENLGDFYDCGCADKDEPKEKDKEKDKRAPTQKRLRVDAAAAQRRVDVARAMNDQTTHDETRADSKTRNVG